jgi:THO complex subunit 2
VGKLKGDEREDLKVLATGVAAALAARKVSHCFVPPSPPPTPSGSPPPTPSGYTKVMFHIMQSSWLSEEDFGMGHLDLKPAAARSVSGK